MDLASAQTQLAAWEAASIACAAGQSYSVAGRSVTRADGAEIRNQISYWQRVVNALTAQGEGSATPGVKVASWV